MTEMPPIDILMLRNKLDMSPEKFSQTFAIPLQLLLAWENKSHIPDIASLLVLHLIDRIPDKIEAIARKLIY